jgi:hypothetical protein
MRAPRATPALELGGLLVAEHIACPRCGARDSFIKGYLPDTCVCRVCQSQLDYREIPGCGPDCTWRKSEPASSGEARSGGETAGETGGGETAPVAD